MKQKYIKRLIHVPARSFFLFGPRGTGKSTWLKKVLPNASYFDLLDASLFLELSKDPHRLEAMIGNLHKGEWVVIDEIQKVLPLLDEVHRLMVNRQWKFVLCGSSARKLRQSGVNLLAGRAITLNMESFSYAELGDAFNLDSALEWGLLPFVQLDPKNAADILNAYVNTYIREEIKEESIVRKISPFIRFLAIAGLLNGQSVNGQNIARDAAVSRSSVDVYFSILIDTLLGHFLHAFRPRLKIREQTHPKFYWFDPGVARAAAGLSYDPVDRHWKGYTLETLIYHELRVYNETRKKHRQISYYRTSAGVEIDFIIEVKKPLSGTTPHVICIEVKLSDKWNRRWEKPMRDMSSHSGIVVRKMIGVYTGERTYHYEGVDILPVEEFLKQLYDGKIY